MLLSNHTNMYELTILTGRQCFWEPNKISFIIFGYLYYFILITKVQLRIKIKSYFYFPWKNKPISAQRGPRGARPTCGGGPGWGARAHAGTLAKMPSHYETIARTISIDSDFTTEPRIISPSHQRGPRDAPRSPTRRTMALDGTPTAQGSHQPN